MKLRSFSVIAALTLGLILGSVGMVFAAETFEGLPVVKVLLNGAPLKSDVPPVVLAGRTMLPVRAIAEAVGLEVQWDAATSTVVLKNKAGGLVYADTFVKVTNPMVAKDAHGMTEMMVDVTNVYTDSVSGPMVVTYFDHDGMVIGKATGTVTALAAGATQSVSLMAEKFIGEYAHYKITSDVMSHH